MSDEALPRSESAATILDRVTDAYFAVDGEWRITAMNGAARRVFADVVGERAAHLVGQVLWDALPQLSGTRFEHEYREAMARSRAAHFEAFFQPWSVWFEVHAYPSPEGLSIYFRDVTESRRVQEALKESEAVLRQLAETIHEVLWVISPDLSRVEYVNRAYEEIFGRSRASLYENAGGFLDAVVEEDRARVLRGLSTIQSEDFVTEFRIRRPDGEVRWIWTRAAAVRDDAGTMLRVVGLAEDISGRKETEEQQAFLTEASRVLTSSLDYEETLRAITRLAVPEIADWCAIYVVDDGSVRTIEVAHVNPAKLALARQLAELYPDDPEADTGVYHVVRAGEAQFYPDIAEDMLESLATDEQHLRLLRELGLRSGMTVPMRARGRSLGAITFMAAESGRRYSEYDLRFAEQLAARAALAVDNARLYAEAHRRAIEERALRHAAEAVTAPATVDQVIEEIARSALETTASDGAFVELLDAERAEVCVVASCGECALPTGAVLPLAGSYAEYVLERGAPSFVTRVGDASRPLPATLRETCPDSAALVVPLADAGEAIGALFLLRDAGHGAFGEDDAARATTFANLAALAYRKVHLLEESEKRRTALESVMESRARLVRGFTHDLRNPLGAADGFLDLVESGIYGNLSEQQSGAISRARRLLRSALALVGDVLELARVEAGLPGVELAPVDVGAAARELAEEYRAQAEAKGLELGVHAAEKLPQVVSDAARVRQILGNLLSNAIKFTLSGRVDVEVRVRDHGPAPVPSEWLAIDVRDTGPGVPEQDQHLLFREFSRLGDGEQSGVGLGLAISRSLAEALGGTITVQSAEGQGATFTLWLPLALAHA